MKKSILTLVLIVFTLSGMAGSLERGISIIPEPVSIVKMEGHYLLPEVVTIATPSDRLSSKAVEGETIARPR